jgi:septal ring factor EnvC (AmiA/AmiB activator)
MNKIKEQETDPVQKAQDKLDKARRIADLKKQIDGIKDEEALDDKDKETIKPIIKQLKKSVKAHDKQAKQLQKDIEDETDLEEFTSSQIDRLKKEYEGLRGKEKSVRPERFAQLRKMMRRFPKANLLKLAKADIPILSSGARASLVVNHGMKFSQIPEDFIPYIDIFADDNKELSEQKKGKFASVDPKVIDRIEKMMRGTRKEKDSIANMLNYFMPPEVVDMVRYKLKIAPKRGKIKF